MTGSPDGGFDQMVYLLSSARMALDEPVLYASFRLLEGASRAIAAQPVRDQFLEDLLLEIEDMKLHVIDDAAGYATWLDDVLRRVVSEAKQRNTLLFPPGGPGDQHLT
jgi:hypothetical protein